MDDTKQADVAIVGGGLGGLTAAAYLARAGLSVALFEKARSFGGRGASQDESGFRLNLGPHALYVAGEAIAALRELGVPFQGHRPAANGAYGIYRGRKHALPGGPVSLLTTSLLGLGGKLEVARLMSSLPKVDAAAYDGITVAEWLQTHVRDQVARELLQALFRVSTYANAPRLQAAGTALRQLQQALGDGVLYLDGGWQTLVDGLRRVAVDAGARCEAGARIQAVEIVDGAVRGVRFGDGSRLGARAVLIAGSPDDAANLSPSLAHLTNGLIPIRAACLDLCLQRLPEPRSTFALGIDQPLYLSVHSAVAKLAPANGAMVHLARYLPCGEDSDPKQDRSELEQLMDTVQPGWRTEVVFERFLPSMTVSHSLLTTSRHGLAGRPKVQVDGVAGLYLAGDWVGAHGQLLDASIASARDAAVAIRSRLESMVTAGTDELPGASASLRSSAGAAPARLSAAATIDSTTLH